MEEMKPQFVTDQNISQMISSYLLRNPGLLYSLQKQVAIEPVPVHPKKEPSPATSSSVH